MDIKKDYKAYDELKTGESECKVCKGTGQIEIKKDKKYQRFFSSHISCQKCYGDGKLDWIENVVGKRINEEVERNINSQIFMEWSCWFPEDDVPFKKSSEEIKQSIDKDYRKKLERKIAYNLSR